MKDYSKMDYDDLQKEQRILAADVVSAGLKGKVNEELSRNFAEVENLIAQNEHITDDKIKEFLSYMENEFPKPMEHSFTRELVENVVRYAYENHGHTSWSAVYMICDIIPEICVEEVTITNMLSKFGFRKERK